MPNNIKLSNFINKLNIHTTYLLFFIISFVFVLNYPKLRFYFLSDDFVFIFNCQYFKNLLNTSASYHFNPVTQVLFFYIGNILSGINPHYYHFITLLLHTVNVLFVFHFSQILFKNKAVSLAASLLFATYFMNYEVVYWITGIFYILLTFFYLATIFFFREYLRKRNFISYSLFLTSFFLTIFTMEQGITLILVCFFYEILLSETPKRYQVLHWNQMPLFFLSDFKKYIPPGVVTILFLVIKKSMNQSLTVEMQAFEIFIKTVSGILWHLFIPYPYGVNNGIYYNTTQWDYRIYVSLLITFAAVIYLIFRFTTKKESFILKRNPIPSANSAAYLFLLLSIISYIIMNSIATGTQARYFYLPSVFSSIILGNILINNVYNILRKKHVLTLFISSLFIVFISASIPINIKFLKKQQLSWEDASKIAKNIIQDTGTYFPEISGTLNIYYVNLPDGIYSINNFGWPDAYIFRNGIFEAIKLNYATRKISEVRAYRTSDPQGVKTWIGHELLTPDQLNDLAKSENNLLLIYDYKKKTIEK